MSGCRITDQQVKRYMNFKKTRTQASAAAKAGMSERSARRIDKQKLQPQQSNPRLWRTRQDPLAAVWESLVLPWICQNDDITPVGIYDYLCEHYRDEFSPSSRRTLERRISQWRALHGPAKDVMFRQTHEYGALGIADFTHVNADVTIAGEPLKHMIFHYRMPASGWAYAQVIYGGESFAALSDGLQNAFAAAQGVPQQIRTDSLSAAYKNRSSKDDFTERYAELAKHYGFKPTRNNPGVAHENGAIEVAHRHLKSQLLQALKLRGSRDFKNETHYEHFVSDLIERRNRRVRDKYTLEQRQLQVLPCHTSVNYTECYVSVTRSSTIALKRVTYTVPSRLIGKRLLVRVYDKHLALYLGVDKVLELERRYGAKGSERVRSVNYQHIIDALHKKPLAFRHSQLRDDILPNDNYRAIWRYADEHLPADAACYYIVKVLFLAYRYHCERQLEQYVLDGVYQHQLPSLRQCEERVMPTPPLPAAITVSQHALKSYNQLLGGQYA